MNQGVEIILYYDTSILCVTKFMGKEVLNLQRHSWTGNVFKGKERLNVLKRQHMDKCSKDGSGGMVQNVCQALSS